MEHSLKRASFEGIPPEIRLNIYSYILSDRNVIVLKPKRVLRPQYQTALFTLNRRISTESLAYFWSENAFVKVGTNMGYFLSTCTHAIPLIVGDNLRHFLHFVLSVELITHNAAAAAHSEEHYLAIIAAKHLSNFVWLINAEHSTIRNTGHTSTVHLRYYTKNNLFGIKPSVTEFIVDGMKGIRKIQNREESRLEINIGGDLDAQKAEEIKAATNPPALTLAEILGEAEEAKERGNKLYREGNYNAARGEYSISVYMAGNMRNEFVEHPILLYKFESLFINIHTNSSLLDTKQGVYESAFSQAEKAWDLTVNRTGGDTSTPVQKAKLLYRLGCNFWRYW